MIKDINELIKALEKSGLAGISFDKELLNNKENALKLVVIDDYIIGELPDDLKRDKDVIKSALEANGMAYDYLDEEDKTNKKYALIAVANTEEILPSIYEYIPFTKSFIEKIDEANGEWYTCLPDEYFEDGQLMVKLFKATEEIMAYDDFFYYIPYDSLADIDYMKYLVKYNWFIINEADEDIRHDLLKYVKKEDRAEARASIE